MPQTTTLNISGIYGLLDPDTRELRYIGCSANIHGRWVNHCKIQTCEKFKPTYLHKWLRKISSKPIVILLEKTEKLEQREQYWIAYYREEGARLVNATNGGEGIVGYRFSEEQKKMISESTKRGMAAMPEEKKQRLYAQATKNCQDYSRRIAKKIIDQDGNIYTTKEAMKKFNLTQGGISYRALKQILYKGIRLRYL